MDKRISFIYRFLYCQGSWISTYNKVFKHIASWNLILGNKFCSLWERIEVVHKCWHKVWTLHTRNGIRSWRAHSILASSSYRARFTDAGDARCLWLNKNIGCPKMIRSLLDLHCIALNSLLYNFLHFSVCSDSYIHIFSSELCSQISLQQR